MLGHSTFDARGAPVRQMTAKYAIILSQESVKVGEDDFYA